MEKKTPGPLKRWSGRLCAFGRYLAQNKTQPPGHPNMTGGLRLILNFYQIVYLLLSTDFLRTQNPTHWRKELYRTVATQTSYDTCGSVVRDTSLEVCRVHAHFSEPCGGACCAEDLFLPGGSSTRWAPPRFDTRIGDLACTIQYIGLTSSFLTILYNKIERNAIGIVKNMIFLKKGMGDTVQCAKCDRDVTGVV